MTHRFLVGEEHDRVVERCQWIFNSDTDGYSLVSWTDDGEAVMFGIKWRESNDDCVCGQCPPERFLFEYYSDAAMERMAANDDDTIPDMVLVSNTVDNLLLTVLSMIKFGIIPGCKPDRDTMELIASQPARSN